MDMTTDKVRSLVKKWQTLVQAFVDLKTTDGYVLRVFCIGFTKRQKHSTKKTAYAQSSQIKAIRNRMREVIKKEANDCDLKSLVGRLVTDEISKEIEKAVKVHFLTVVLDSSICQSLRVSLSRHTCDERAHACSCVHVFF